MKVTRCILFLVLIFFAHFLWAQEYSKADQYKQALQNAKDAFNAKQYSQAVLFYREAQQIKPESLLPRYKIEDIRTIYIQKELKASQKEEMPLTKKEDKKKEAKEDKPVVDEIIEARATEKMNREVEALQVELNELKVTNLEIEEEPIAIDNSTISIEPIPADRQTNVDPMPVKTQELQSNAVKATQTELKSETKEKPTGKIVEKDTVKPVKTVSTVIKKEEPQKVQKSVNQPKKIMNPEERKVWIEAEQKKLAINYPNKKTIEVMDKPGKHITRIIMNIDNKVTIYLKVNHSWGATYFFIEEIGQELKSINEQYFNLMTNLNTYGN